MSLLSTIVSGVRPLPPRVLIYGTDKIGKNTWAAGAPSPIVIQAEEGSDELGIPRFPLATDFQAVISQLKALAEEDHPYQTVIVDSADWLERLIWDAVISEETNPKWSKSIELVGGGYGKGYMHAADKWRELLDALKYLRNHKGMIVILLCHHEVKSVNLPEVDPFDRYQPKLHKYAMGMLKEWADVIGFAGYKTFSKSVEVSGDKTVTKGVGSGERVLQLTERPTHLAGNRYALPDSLPFPKVGGFDLFMSHVSQFFATQASATSAAAK